MEWPGGRLDRGQSLPLGHQPHDLPHDLPQLNPQVALLHVHPLRHQPVTRLHTHATRRYTVATLLRRIVKLTSAATQTTLANAGRATCPLPRVTRGALQHLTPLLLRQRTRPLARRTTRRARSQRLPRRCTPPCTLVQHSCTVAICSPRSVKPARVAPQHTRASAGTGTCPLRRVDSDVSVHRTLPMLPLCQPPLQLSC